MHSASTPSKATSSHTLVLSGYGHPFPECSRHLAHTSNPWRRYRSREGGAQILSSIKSWIASAGAALAAFQLRERSGVRRSMQDLSQPKIVLLSSPPAVSEDIDSKVRARLEESVKAQLRLDLREDVVDDLFEELEDEVADELRSDLQEDVRQELRDELVELMRDELQLAGMADEDKLDEDIKSAIEDAILDDDDDLSEWLAAERTKPIIDPGSLSEEEMEIWDQLAEELEEEVCEELRGECEPFVRDELREELCMEIKKELREELEDEVRNDLRWSIGAV